MIKFGQINLVCFRDMTDIVCPLLKQFAKIEKRFSPRDDIIIGGNANYCETGQK